jgi:hypothetical protein
MYTIKRHKLLNIYYLHDQYSGPITEEYEVVEEVGNYSEVQSRLKDYQETANPSYDGLFEDYYKYEHMKSVWGDPEGLKPSIGQLFFICLKEMHSQFRTYFELCEVKAIQEPHVHYFNHATSKRDRMTFAQFQGNALIPERDESFIQNWESKVRIRYPRNLISTLLNDGYRYKQISIAKNYNEWDLPKVEMKRYLGA